MRADRPIPPISERADDSGMDNSTPTPEQPSSFLAEPGWVFVACRTPSGSKVHSSMARVNAGHTHQAVCGARAGYEVARNEDFAKIAPMLTCRSCYVGGQR